ncbi:hypothetical protein C0431_06960 [bacterium]|nr:hypothetical protein [bacterium]
MKPCFLALIVALSSFGWGQCDRKVSISGEDFVYFIEGDGGIIVYGKAGYAFAKTEVSAASMAVVGRAFAVDRVELDGGDQPPSSLVWVVMRRMFQHNPCSVPEFFENTAGGYAIPIAQEALDEHGSIIPGEYEWNLSGASGHFTAMKNYMDSFPGIFRVEIRKGSNIGTAVVTSQKGPFYWVDTSAWDASYNENGDDPGNGDGWGSGEGFDDDGQGGGITADDLNNQNINQRTWWEELFIGLFQPSEAAMENLSDAMMELLDWGPFGLLSTLFALSNEATMGPNAYEIDLPTPFGTMTMDMSPYSGFIIFARYLMAGLLWWTVLNRAWKIIFSKA